MWLFVINHNIHDHSPWVLPSDCLVHSVMSKGLVQLNHLVSLFDNAIAKDAMSAILLPAHLHHVKVAEMCLL